MKKLKYLLFIAVAFTACKKTEPQFDSLTSLNVTNAVVGGTTLTLNTSVLTVANNSFSQFALTTGQSTVNLYPAAIPSSPYYNQTLPTTSGSYYSLFLAGSSPTSVDAIVVKETYQNYTDSLCGVRFINLSPNSNPISVNITGSGNGSEVTSLAYKAYGSFKQYAAKAVNASYAFQVRDVGTGTIIASYTLTTPRFHNVTIALRGLVGGSPAAGITLINDY